MLLWTYFNSKTKTSKHIKQLYLLVQIWSWGGLGGQRLSYPSVRCQTQAVLLEASGGEGISYYLYGCPGRLLAKTPKYIWYKNNNIYDSIMVNDRTFCISYLISLPVKKEDKLSTSSLVGEEIEIKTRLRNLSMVSLPTAKRAMIHFQICLVACSYFFLYFRLSPRKNSLLW